MTTATPSSSPLKPVEASFAEEAARHASIISRLATFLDEHGFVVIPHDRLTPLAGGWLEGYFERAVGIWGEMAGAKYLVIHLYNNDAFTFTLPRTRRLRPIVVALRMMAQVRHQGERGFVGQGFLYLRETSNDYRFSGKGMKDLKTVTAMLAQEDHRMILKSQHRPKTLS